MTFSNLTRTLSVPPCVQRVPHGPDTLRVGVSNSPGSHFNPVRVIVLLSVKVGASAQCVSLSLQKPFLAPSLSLCLCVCVFLNAAVSPNKRCNRQRLKALKRFCGNFHLFGLEELRVFLTSKPYIMKVARPHPIRFSEAIAKMNWTRGSGELVNGEDALHEQKLLTFSTLTQSNRLFMWPLNFPIVQLEWSAGSALLRLTCRSSFSANAREAKTAKKKNKKQCFLIYSSPLCFFIYLSEVVAGWMDMVGVSRPARDFLRLRYMLSMLMGDVIKISV